MARADILNILYAKDKNPLEFVFDSLWIPSMYNYITTDDIQQLNYIATSARYNANIDLKYKAINDIMTRRGFRKFHAGTNRVVYTHLEDPRFVAKIAIDKVGLSDNPNEYNNQHLLKPFVTKVFEVSPCGTIAFVERIEPITSISEFASIAGDVYDVLTECILGIYALEDVGCDYFMNWGIRKGFGPCLLDYPYVFELDGNKLHCNAPETDKITGLPIGVCDGEIDYDVGFNNLICKKCGKQYFARELAVMQKNKLIILKGENDMAFTVCIKRGDEVIAGSEYMKSTDIFVKPQPKCETVSKEEFKVIIHWPDEDKNIESTPPTSDVEDDHVTDIEVIVDKTEEEDTPEEVESSDEESVDGEDNIDRVYDTQNFNYSYNTDDIGKIYIRRFVKVEHDTGDPTTTTYIIKKPKNNVAYIYPDGSIRVYVQNNWLFINEDEIIEESKPDETATVENYHNEIASMQVDNNSRGYDRHQNKFKDKNKYNKKFNREEDNYMDNF